MKKLFFVYILCILFLLSCAGLRAGRKTTSPKEDSTFSRLISEVGSPPNVLLQSGYFDDKYDLNRTNSIPRIALHADPRPYDCLAPVFFFKNRVICISYLLRYNDYIVKFANDSLSYKRYNGTFDWGTYEVRGDTINALVFAEYEHSGFPYWGERLTYYRGIIKDSTTIVDWLIVPPYPRHVFHQFEEVGEKPLPCVLKFVPFKEKSLIDGDKAWVNKYRTKLK